MFPIFLNATNLTFFPKMTPLKTVLIKIYSLSPLEIKCKIFFLNQEVYVRPILHQYTMLIQVPSAFLNSVESNSTFVKSNQISKLPEQKLLFWFYSGKCNKNQLPCHPLSCLTHLSLMNRRREQADF